MKPRLFATSVVAAWALSVSLHADHAAEKLGTIQFAASGTPAVQADVVRGVKLVHHMMYVEADQAFAGVLAADPHNAFAWWGRAMAIIHPLWPDSPTADERRNGAEYVRRGLAAASANSREHAYLEALAPYFDDAAASDLPTRLKLLDESFGKLADRFPDDLDALAFSALYHLAPARFLAKDKSHRIQLEAVTRIQRVLAKIPDHPGAQHYKIHALDFPLLADRALEVCDTYSGIAPDVPHALHMPTHIFTRRGLWQESIDFNRRSADAARRIGDTSGFINGHYAHALDYLTYAYLQRGQYGEADKILRLTRTLVGPYANAQLTTMAFAFAAIPARCALERQAWSEAASLPLHEPATFPWGKAYLYCDAIVHFARAIGAARSGALDAADAEIAALERTQHDMAAVNRIAYWNAQAETQLLAARAWVRFARKDTAEAIALMRHAAELEATSEKEAVTPGEVLPAGELLGDLLLAADRPVEALAAYEAQLAASPNRLNTLYGAGLAAERSDQSDKARGYFTQLAQTAAEADANLPRVEHARAFLQRSPARPGE